MDEHNQNVNKERKYKKVPNKSENWTEKYRGSAAEWMKKHKSVSSKTKQWSSSRQSSIMEKIFLSEDPWSHKVKQTNIYILGVPEA